MVKQPALDNQAACFRQPSRGQCRVTRRTADGCRPIAPSIPAIGAAQGNFHCEAAHGRVQWQDDHGNTTRVPSTVLNRLFATKLSGSHASRDRWDAMYQVVGFSEKAFPSIVERELWPGSARSQLLRTRFNWCELESRKLQSFGALRANSLLLLYLRKRGGSIPALSVV